MSLDEIGKTITRSQPARTARGQQAGSNDSPATEIASNECDRQPDAWAGDERPDRRVTVRVQDGVEA